MNNVNTVITTHADKLNPHELETGIYWYRWYIVLLFGLIGLMESVIWNTWSPISTSAFCAFEFTSSDIELLANWGPITLLMFMPVYAWLLNNKGLRISILSASVFLAIAGVLRCFPLPTNIFKYFVHAGQISNGIAGCAILGAPPLLSNTWFPPAERVTATSLATLVPATGVGIIYILGPAIVQEPSKNLTNETTCNVSDEEKSAIRHDIMTLMYIEFAVSTFLLICCIIFYPNKPPLPPSVTASMDRLDFKKGVWALRKNKPFILSALVLALVIGLFFGFSGILDVLLSPFGMNQKTVGSIGFLSAMIGNALGLVIGWIADKWKGHIKIILVILFGFSFVSMLYFTFITSNWFHVKAFQCSDAGVWVTLMALGIAMYASPGITNELIVETAYPTGEGVSTSILVWLMNVYSFILLTSLSVSSGNSYAIYIMLGSIAITLVLLIFFIREPNSRLHLDQDNEHIEDEDNTDTSRLIANAVFS